jgi:hypothetical protein
VGVHAFISFAVFRSLHRQPLQDSDDEVYVIAMPNKKNQLPRQQHGKNMRREEQEEIASSWVIIH